MGYQRAKEAAYDFVLDARSHAKSLISGGFRVSRKFMPASGGKLQLVAVLEHYDGMRAFRLLATFAGHLPTFSVLGLDGKEMGADIGLASSIDATGERKQAVISVILPKAVGAFIVASSQTGALMVSRGDINRHVRTRDAMMINPAIDMRYQHARGSKCECCASCACDDAQDLKPLCVSPKFSIIVPLFETPVGFFKEMVGSVIEQTYSNWELVLINVTPGDERLAAAIRKAAKADSRIKVLGPFENKGISLNTRAGLDIATGDYFAFLDHDDLLEPCALELYAHEIEDHPEADLIYCDEDSVTHDGKMCFEPRFKPGVNPDLLLTHNYFVHFLCVSRDAYKKIAPYESDVDGAQDFDLSLKVSEVARKIRHIPKVLYHWRAHEGSTNGGLTQAKPYVVESSIHAITRAFERRGINAAVKATDVSCVFETDYPPSDARDVTLLLAYESVQDLAGHLASLEGQRKIVREAICAGPALDEEARFFLCGSSGIEPEALLSGIADVPVKLINNEDASFGAKISMAASAAKSDYLLICDESVRFDPASDCIGRLRDAMCRNDVGISAAKAFTSEGLIAHAGICVKDDGSFGYLNQGFAKDMGGGYHGCAECDCDYTAADALCAMVRSSDFEQVSDISTDYDGRLAASVDLSFRMRQLGKLVLVRPSAYATVYVKPHYLALGASHIVPKSRDYARLWERWSDKYREDVLGNPNVTLDRSYFNLRQSS